MMKNVTESLAGRVAILDLKGFSLKEIENEEQIPFIPTNDFIAINLRRNTKASIADTLGHECEHGFTQHADIHLAGIADLRSKNPYSRRFFDGIVNRFNRVKKGSAEYERAKVYAQEVNKYEDIAFSGGEENNMRAYLSLNAEKDAFRAGELEGQVFEKCFKDFVKNFSLFNRSYMMKG